MTTATNAATCFCGERHDERAICRDCGSLIMRHDEPGLMGWFAYDMNAATYADGDCARNAMNAFHRPAEPADVAGLQVGPLTVAIHQSNEHPNVPGCLDMDRETALSLITAYTALTLRRSAVPA